MNWYKTSQLVNPSEPQEIKSFEPKKEEPQRESILNVPPGKKPFITDMGKDEFMTWTAKDGTQSKEILPRYGVWIYDQSRGKHQVKETGSDLPILLQKYNLTEQDVHSIRQSI